MTTNHKPATPLPWAAKELHPNYGGHVVMHDIKGGTRRVDKDKSGCFAELDADYITHAANAYPRLVEALRDIEMETRSGGQWTAAEINEVACSILRELGEE